MGRDEEGTSRYVPITFHQKSESLSLIAAGFFPVPMMLFQGKREWEGKTNMIFRIRSQKATHG